MDVFEMVEAMRNKHGFSEKNYAKYRTYLRAEMKKPESKGFGCIRKCESNLSKFLMIGSVNFLKKNMKILEKEGSESSRIYSKLMEALVRCAVGDPIDIDSILELRGQLLLFRSFLDQVDSLIESPSYNFDSSSLKVKHLWEDIEVCFDTEKERAMFLSDGVLPSGCRYDAALAKHIFLIEKRRRQLFSLIESKPTRVLCIHKKIKVLLSVLDAASKFLDENLVSSAYIQESIKEAKEMEGYYSRVLDFTQFVRWDESIDLFSVPSMFMGLRSQILVARESTLCISRKHVLRNLFKYFEDYFKPVRCSINMPFTPSIFDVAGDYVNYPTVDRKVSRKSVD